jgi:hypothetical protein
MVNWQDGVEWMDGSLQNGWWQGVGKDVGRTVGTTLRRRRIGRTDGREVSGTVGGYVRRTDREMQGRIVNLR